MSATASLKDFVKEQLSDKRFVSRAEELKQWREDVHALYRQVTDWIHAADPEGRVFVVEHSPMFLEQDEKYYGTFGIESLVIRLLTADATIVYLSHRALATTRKNTLGLLEMSSSLKRFYLYRLASRRGVAAEWELVNADTNRSEPWSQSSFESALQYLVK